ncbi:uncharacterized protein [Chironomus tepperi]|uniref:uncharacterized protein isoform X3 n=1 Tax=Chironomus tepperi TaxID=113505 RepID=UPI00391FB610
MQRRKKRTTKVRKKVNNCAYCKIHGEERLAKGHRGKCKYNVKEHIDKCPDCLKNQEKTVRMQKYRNNNSESRTDDSRVTSSTLEAATVLGVNSDIKDSWIPYDDSETPPENEEYLKDGTDSDKLTWGAYKNERKMKSFLQFKKNGLRDKFQALKLKSAKTEETNNTKFPENLIEDFLTFAIIPKEFPKTYLTMEYVKEIIIMIETGKSQIPDGERMPQIVYMISEAGYCKVKVINAFSKKWIVDKIARLSYHNMPLIVTPVSRIPKCFYAAGIPGEILDDLMILTKFQKALTQIVGLF